MDPEDVRSEADVNVEVAAVGVEATGTTKNKKEFGDTKDKEGKRGEVTQMEKEEKQKETQELRVSQPKSVVSLLHSCSFSLANIPKQLWQRVLLHAPVALFPASMGLGGLGLVWKRMSAVLSDIPVEICYVLLSLAAANFAVFLLVYAVKVVKNFTEVKEEWNHPIKANFFPAIAISFLIFSAGFIPEWNEVAKVLWWIGAVLQMIFTLALAGRWFLTDSVKQQHCNPSCLIPVVGNMLVGVPGGRLEYEELSWLFFSVGVIFWIIMLANIFSKMVFGDSPPVETYPMLFTLASPGAVGMITWVALNGDAGATGRFFYWNGIFFTVFMFRLYPIMYKTLKYGFRMSWWGFTFPMDAVTLSSLDYYQSTVYTEAANWSWILIVFTNIIVFLIYAAFLHAAWEGRVFVPELEENRKSVM